MKSTAANDDVPLDPALTISALLRRREEVSDEAFDSLLKEQEVQPADWGEGAGG